MPPKKQVKKEVEEPPKQQIPEIPLHQLQGVGRFTYPSGSEYVGDWRLFNGIKLKHGKGILTVQKVGSNASNKEVYDGDWSEDKMQGKGTYNFYDGAVYRGEWKNNQQSGLGTYEFSNGTIYQGQWQHQLMHGTGLFIDHTGKKWAGQFRKGKFQSKNQTELVKEKAITVKKIEIKKEVEAIFVTLLEAVAKSDKKTLKQNLAPFFATADNLKEFVKEPYSKFDERAPEKWTEIITSVKSGTYKVLETIEQATFIASERILAQQLQGNGQMVEVQGAKDDKLIKIGVVGVQNKRWNIVCVSEQDRKK